MFSSGLLRWMIRLESFAFEIVKVITRDKYITTAKDAHLNETSNLTDVFRERSGARDQLIEGIRLYRR